MGAACLAVVLTYVATAVYDEQPTPPLPRFEPAAEPATDERYFGASPKGAKGGGYADMRGAKPLAGS